jgi:hypothetical protein
MTVDMTTRLGSLTLPNPVLTASGCAAAGRELSQFFDVSELGAVVTKSIQLRARSGRATPRMAETPSGMLNSIGLQGPASTPSCAKTCRGWRATVPAPSCPSPAAARRVRLASPAAVRKPGGVDDRGQHLLPECGEARRGVRLRTQRGAHG